MLGVFVCVCVLCFVFFLDTQNHSSLYLTSAWKSSFTLTVCFVLFLPFKNQHVSAPPSSSSSSCLTWSLMTQDYLTSLLFDWQQAKPSNHRVSFVALRLIHFVKMSSTEKRPFVVKPFKCAAVAEQSGDILISRHCIFTKGFWALKTCSSSPKVFLFFVFFICEYS